MSGFWSLSRAQRNDLNGEPIPGCLAYFYEGGTTTPMPVYQDAGLALVHPNPIETDANGTWPAVYFDDASYSFYRVRVTDPDGVEIFDDTAVPIIGQQVGEGGAEVPIDINSTLATGDVKCRYGTGSLSGWVRANGRTIGSASSGATERANSDAQDLFEYLWGADANLSVSGGRGGSAAADWSANKTLTLPDFRGRAPFGLDDMGNSAASRITSGTTLGASGGDEEHTLIEDELPEVSLSGTTSENGLHGHPFRTAEPGGSSSQGGLLTDETSQQNRPAFTGTPSATAGQQIGGAGAHTHTLTIDSFGSGDPHNNMPPYILITWYLRL